MRALTYMDMLAVYYNNSKHVDRVCRPRAMADSKRRARVSMELEPAHRMADYAGHSMDNHYMDHSRRRKDRKDRKGHSRRQCSIRRRNEGVRRHQHKSQRLQRNACACCSLPWSCWRTAAETRPGSRWASESTCNRDVLGKPPLGTCLAGHSV